MTIDLRKVPAEEVDRDDVLLFSESSGRFIVTLDPANPPLPAYRAAFEYRMKRQPFPANREHAANALIYIITRLKNADMVPFEEWQVDWAAQEYVNKECTK